jgi:hypothetical protein
MKRILLLLVASVAFVGAASAQYSTRGFFVRPHLVGAAWRLDDFEEDAEAGGGLGLALGYGFNERVAAYLEFSGANIDPDTGSDYGLGHFDLGAMFTVGSYASRLKGNFMVALNGRAAELDQPGADIEASGAGLTLGGGVLWFTSPNLALDLNLLFTVGEISEVEVNGLTWNTNLDATSTRLNLGVAWFPGR